MTDADRDELNDTDRAERFITNWTTITARAAVLASGVLQADYEAVRLEERRAIVAWLRAEAPTRRLEVDGLITGLSDDIEAGEHTLRARA